MSLCNDVAIEKFLENEFGQVSPDRRGLFIDLGCGAQPYRSLYVNRFKQVLAVDYNSRSRIDVRLDVTRLPFRDRSADVLLLSEVIEHVLDGARVLGEVSRVLKPGGVLLITWPFMYPLHDLPHDYVRYTEFAVQQLAEQCGLQIATLERRGNIFCVAGALAEQMLHSALTGVTRIPGIGKMFRPLLPLSQSLARACWKRYLHWNAGVPGAHSDRSGTNMNRRVNHLSLWTLGYCARITKPEGHV